MARNTIRLQQGLLTAEQRTRIRTACQDARERAIIETLWTTRRAEAAGLRWADLDTDKGLMLIQQGKGGDAAWTLMLESTRAAIVAWRAASGPVGAEDWVFPVPGSGRPGVPYKPASLAKVVQGILTRAGCWAPGLGNCHRFRRSFATAYIKEHPGAITELQALMRHRSVSTTALYIHYAPEDLAPRLAQVRI